MSVSTAISRVTGFIRIGAMAYALGGGFFASSYQAANNVPNMIYELVAGGVLSSMFIPIFLETLNDEGDEGASRLASSVFNLAMIALSVIALVATIWPYPFIKSQMLGKSAAQLAEGMFLFRFFAIQVVFYGANIIMAGMLNAKRHFLAPALGPIFNNLVVIATFLAYVPLRDSGNLQWAHIELAVGTTIGVVAQMSACIPPLLRMKFRYFPVIDLRMPAVRSMGRKMIPLVGYVAVNLVGVSLRNSFATAANDGGIAKLGYAWVFYQLPYGILAVALATAFFPEISDRANAKDWEGFRKQFGRGMRATALLVIPAAAIVAALSTPLVSLLVRRDFLPSDVPLTASVLAIWAFGLFSFAGYMFAVRGFYSLQDTSTPAKTNTVLTLVVQIGLYALFTLGVMGWRGLGLVGIPAADVAFYTVHMLVLLFLLGRRVGGIDARRLVSTVARVTLASAVGGGVAFAIARLTPQLSVGFLRLVAQITLAAVPGLAVTFALASLMRVSEIAVAGQMLGRYAGRFLPSSGKR
jgi:putative peptidoglycan lipid II flippase